ncbi:helix-turn-helix domain-containing protein [Luteolibacter sp. Populi]|uniref:helix-turn-helix domain-containing protein n=1 Tax=Luteolibacter sp. Populi TaxID=3230487 RepID=UPI003466C0DB
MLPATPLLTRQQAARFLSVSVRTLDGLIRTGHLPQVKMGKSVRFRHSTLEAFVDARESRASSLACPAEGKEGGQ